MEWFECKVSYEKTMQNGALKKVTESYLVDALSHAEAEARITEEMKPYIRGEYTVSSVRRVSFNEFFFYETGAKYYKVKIALETLDEKTGAERKTKINVLAQASDLQSAIIIVKQGMKGTLADYELVSVGETAIMDVYQYK